MKEIIKEHAGFLKQIWKLSKSELIITYKGAALGPAKRKQASSYRQ